MTPPLGCVPLRSTRPHGDAVTVRYRTILYRTEADFRHSLNRPSQAHQGGQSSASRCYQPVFSSELRWRALPDTLDHVV